VRAQIKLGRIFGIEIGLHYSWLIIAVLILFSLGGQFAMVNRDWGTGVIWGAAVITTILFFISILLHELGHSVVAQSRGIPVPSIVLFALGGVSQMQREPEKASTEFWMALTGPLVSVVIGVVCIAGARSMGWSSASQPASPAASVIGWLGYINVILALFNMVPGYPLDGGRVLRSIIWWKTGSMERATRAAGFVGQGFAFLFILLGLWQFFTGHGFGGLWLAFIGWFLLDASRSSLAQTELMSALRGVRVRDVMERACATVDANVSLQSLVDDHLLRSGARCVVVQKEGYLAGLITPTDIARIDRQLWPVTPIGKAMRPVQELRTISPDALVTQALETMARYNINQLPVVEDGKFDGIFSRAHLLQLLQTRSELKS
jgi:Zn-dependent protease/predicted transcriptional regulator